MPDVVTGVGPGFVRHGVNYGLVVVVVLELVVVVMAGVMITGVTVVVRLTLSSATPLLLR